MNGRKKQRSFKKRKSKSISNKLIRANETSKQKSNSGDFLLIRNDGDLVNSNAPATVIIGGEENEDVYCSIPALSSKGYINDTDSDSDSDSDFDDYCYGRDDEPAFFDLEDGKGESSDMYNDEDSNAVSGAKSNSNHNDLYHTVQEMSIAADSKIILFQQLDSVQFSDYFNRAIEMPAAEFGTFKYRIFHFIMWLKSSLDISPDENVILTVYNFIKLDSTSLFKYCDSLKRNEDKSSCTVRNYCEHLSKFFDWFANNRFKCRSEYRIRSGTYIFYSYLCIWLLSLCVYVGVCVCWRCC